MKPLHPAQLLTQATFQFRSFAEAALVSQFLAHTCPEPTLTDIALSELFTNAIEHGNLNLSYEQKTQLQKENHWLAEIERRLTLPEYKNKSVTVVYTRTSTELQFKITDEGKGFDWKQLKQHITPAQASSSHGRGLDIIKHALFQRVQYSGSGNEVLCVIKLPTS